MTTTVAAKQEIRTLPALDTDAIASDAATWASNQIKGSRGAEARARLAAALIAPLEADKTAALAARDEAACSLLYHFWIRRGADVPKAIGVNRNRWKVIREQQAARFGYTKPAVRDGKEVEVGDWDALVADPAFVFPVVEDVVNMLPVFAEEAAEVKARIDALTKIRTDAVGKLKGWSNADIAELIGRDASLVSRTRTKEVA